MENCPTCPASYAKNGATIMNADGGVEVLINSANEVAGVSSEDVRNTLMSQIEKVSQNPTARNVGQLYATIQTASNEVHASVIPEDVTKILGSKRVNSKTTAGIADAIAASLNGQELTKTQRERLQDRGRFSVLTKHRDMVYWSRVMEYA